MIWFLAGGNNPVAAAIVTVAITAIGVWSSNEVEAYWGVDSNRVVIDEIAGMCISLLFLPVTWGTILTGLILFRFFDMVKPLYIRKAEDLPGGWGVMGDDVLAGIYTNVLLQLAVKLSWL
jgi:phosphatidylglycerophosphatase A